MKKLSTKAKILIAGIVMTIALSAVVVIPEIVKTNGGIDPPVGTPSCILIKK